ncbi:hypothetical protein MD484_g7463, partial [Candolleomyces efflorescens]
MESSLPPGLHLSAKSPTTNDSSQQRQPRPTWTQHCGVYRSIDPSKAWVPSPQVYPSHPPNSSDGQQGMPPDFLLDLTFRKPRSGVEVQSLGSSEGSSSSSSVREPFQLVSVVSPPHPNGSEPTRKRKSTVRRLAGKMRSLGLSIRTDPALANPPPEQDAIPLATSATSSVGRKSSTKVQPHEWKEWGYWARPLVSGFYAHNSSSPTDYPLQHIDDSDMTVEEVLRSLTSPDGTQHPERWKLGMTHPSLPPRPTRWSPPNPTRPLPFPWEVQLNPLLGHVLFGTPRLEWDIKEDITAASLATIPREDGTHEAALLLSDPDLAQPATYPFLTHMYVNALAEDSSPQFAWPFMVLNPHGIKIRDIINSVHDNFQECVREREYYGWTMARRREAARAHRKRCDPQEHPHKAMAGDLEVNDDMRRIDYLGNRTVFRGLAPNPDMTGWVLYLGQD